MPSRPPHPWAPVQPYRDDEPPRIFMSPSESLEDIDHDAHHRRLAIDANANARHGQSRGLVQDYRDDQDTPVISRAAAPGPGGRVGEGRMPNPHTPVQPGGRYDYEKPLDPFSDLSDPHAEHDHDHDAGQGHVYPQPGQSVGAPGAKGNADGYAYTMPGNYPDAYAYGNGNGDPNVNLLAWNNPTNPYMTQELVNVPYRPMQPRFQKWAKSEIKPEDCVLPLLLITFQTGVIDAATIKDFRTYTTGQTGNSILLALAVFGRRPANLLAGGLSMAGFCLFSVVFGQLGNVYGHKTRGWLLFTMSVQIALLIFNIILVSPAMAGVLPEGGPFEWAVIFTAAAQGAGQMVMAINSGCSEINTVGLTGLYAGLGSDPSLFKILSEPHVVKRNRRLWFLVIFWGGTFFGGAIATYSDMWISLIFALECKVVALGMMMLSSAFEVDKGWRQRLKQETELAEAYAE